MLVAPSEFGVLRPTAPRAFAVELDRFPFEDEAAMEWRTSILSCHEPVSGGRLMAPGEMKRNWRTASDERLRRIAGMRGAAH